MLSILAIRSGLQTDIRVLDERYGLLEGNLPIGDDVLQTRKVFERSDYVEQPLGKQVRGMHEEIDIQIKIADKEYVDTVRWIGIWHFDIKKSFFQSMVMKVAIR